MADADAALYRAKALGRNRVQLGRDERLTRITRIGSQYGTIGAMSVQHANDYIDRDGFRANVGIVLMRDSGELFLGGRVGGRGWQFPQGGVNRGEPVEEALFRELKEEIGLGRQDVEILGSTRGWLRYRLPRQYVRDRCIGQKQRWYSA